MVYLHFPSQFTEEEEMLQKKYLKLKRKKKAFQQMKTPKQEPPTNQISLKGPVEVKKDAKEVAKKLLQSGAISAFKVENKERQGFKRPKASERKRVGLDKSASMVTGYQPFSSTHSTEEEPTEYGRPPIKGLYESFVSSRETEEADSTEDKEKEIDKIARPAQGNTIYVHGYGVTEDLLRSTFQSYGNIINISMEMDRHCGFVTFDAVEAADKAIKEMHGKTVGQARIMLKVSLARRQPLIPSASDGSTSSWTAFANYSTKGNHKDKRNLVTYDDDIF